MIDPHDSKRAAVARRSIGLGLILCALAACGSTRHHSDDSKRGTKRALTIESNSECTTRGHFGGAISPSRWQLRIVNRSNSALAWKTVSDQGWLVLPVAQGVTPARSEGEVSAVIDTAATRMLTVGEHRAHVKLFEASDVDVPTSTIDVVLHVDDDGRGAFRAPVETGASGPNAERARDGAGATPIVVVNPISTSAPGWTALQPSPDSRVIYVSSSLGNDANDGLSPQHPKSTIAAGRALLRNGYPDWLCLNRGDVWLGSIGQWIVSGRSASEPTVLTSYGAGSVRPLVATGTGDGLVTIQTAASPSVLRHIRIVGVQFDCSSYTGAEGTPSGINWHVPFEDVLVEDCLFRHFHTNLVIEPLGEAGADFRLRRSIVADAFTTQVSHSQGIYVANVEGVLLEENVFDHNGWREDVPGAVPTIFRHNAYLQTNVSAVRVIGNIFASGASHGLQARQGGLIEDNLFLNNGIALLLGSNWETSAPIRFIARDNVIMSGRDIDPATPRGFGIDVPAASAGLISRNVIAHQGNAGFPVAINLFDGTSSAGLHDVVVDENVICDWNGPVIIQGNAPQLTGLVFRRNRITEHIGSGVLVDNTQLPNGSIAGCGDNRLWSVHTPVNGWCKLASGHVSLDAWKTALADTTTLAWTPNYLDENRTIQSYDLRLGGQGTLESFLVGARRLSKADWRPEFTAANVNDWVRTGFRFTD